MTLLGVVLWNGDINKCNFLVKPQVLVASTCSDIFDSVQAMLDGAREHPHTAEGNSVPAFTARSGLPVWSSWVQLGPVFC